MPFGGGGGAVSLPVNIPQPAGFGFADKLWQSLMGSLAGQWQGGGTPGQMWSGYGNDIIAQALGIPRSRWPFQGPAAAAPAPTPQSAASLAAAPANAGALGPQMSVVWPGDPVLASFVTKADGTLVSPGGQTLIPTEIPGGFVFVPGPHDSSIFSSVAAPPAAAPAPAGPLGGGLGSALSPTGREWQLALASIPGFVNFANLASGAAPGLMSAAFDPQQQLYNRVLNQLMQQQGTMAANSGLLGSPYAAGVENQALSNFNIDWQNNLLNRMTQGAQGLGTLGNIYASGMGGAMSALPRALGMSAQELALLGQGTANFNQAVSFPETLLSNIVPYMGLGTSAASTADQLALQNAQLGFQQSQGLFGGLGSLLGMGLGLFSPFGLFGGSTDLLGGGRG